MNSVKFVDLQGQYHDLKDEIAAAMDRVLGGMRLFLGENTYQLERDFAEFCQVRYAVGVGSGTDALLLALMACDIGPGDEVITVPNSFFATAEAIILAGAVPKFVDIDSVTYTMDPSKLEAAITERTKAVIPVHLYGYPADMAPILEISRRHGLKVIEDACQSHGAGYKGRSVGGLGDAAAFSFYYSKNLGAYGEGGMVVTKDRSIATKVQMLRNHGSIDKYHHSMLGMNSRLDELQAAILRVKLGYLNRWNTKRRAWAKEYEKRLSEFPEIILPVERPLATHVYHLYVIRVARRDSLQRFLSEHGIETGIHYPVPIHLQEACRYLGYADGSFPNTEASAREILSLPMYPELTTDQITYVCQTIQDFLRETKGRRPKRPRLSKAGGMVKR